jgi:hypothetical protein
MLSTSWTQELGTMEIFDYDNILLLPHPGGSRQHEDGGR